MKIKNTVLLIIFSLILIALTTTSYAASFTPKISSTDVKVGDTITITVKADNAAGMYNVKIGNTSILEVTSGATSEFLENNSATIKLKAKKAGSTTVSVTPDDMTDLDDSTKPVTAGGETYTVKVTEITTSTQDKDTTPDTNKKPTITTDKDTSNTDKGSTTTNKDTATTPEKPKEKSNNAYLSTLGVTPKEYDFTGFKKGTTSYSVTVPSDVDSLKVLYKTADSNATVKVTGNSGFEVGSENKITIKVTAEDRKTTKTYTIKVTKLAEEEEKPGNVIEDEEGIYLTSLELEGVEILPKFVKDTYSYTATLEDAEATEIKVNAKANKEEANVDISGNTDLVDGENTINILVTLDGSEEQTVYQVILTKAEKVVEPSINIENNDSENNGTVTDLMGNIKKYIVIAAVVVIFIVVAIIVLIILLRRENRKNNDDEVEDEEYNVYKNDANEFENKKSEADNFIESLYRQRNGNLYNEEELDAEEKQTLEEINRETDKIFRDKVEGQSVEYSLDETQEEIRPRRRSKGKHAK